MSVAQDAFLGTNGSGVSPWIANFRYDQTLLAVNATTPADGAIVPMPLTSIDLLWNESLTGASVDAGDLLLSRGSASSGSLTSPNASSYALSGLTEEGSVFLTVPDGATTDAFGNPNIGYSGVILLDRVNPQDEGQWESLDPDGSLVYRRQLEGWLHDASDVDPFTVMVPPNGTVSANAYSADGLALTLSLYAGGSIVAAASGQPGEPVSLPVVPAQNGLMRLEVSGSGSGSYTLHQLLNAAATTPNATFNPASSAIQLIDLSRQATVGHFAGTDTQHTIQLSGPGGLAISRTDPGSIDVTIPGGLTTPLTHAFPHFTTELPAGTHNLVLAGSGSYSLLFTPARHVSFRDNHITPQAATTGSLGEFVSLPDAIASESEPNDDGIIGGLIGDLDAANDVRGSFTPLGGTVHRAEVTGAVDPGFDQDWDFFRFHARPGDSLELDMLGSPSGNGTLEDPTVRLYDRFGNELAINDDIQDGVQRESQIIYSTFAYDGVYYAVADSWDFTTGTYLLRLTLDTPTLYAPPISESYHYMLNAMDELQVGVHTPYLGPISGSNSLIPTLSLADSNGNNLPIAGGSYTAANGPETVTLTVHAQAGSVGEYELLVTNIPSNLVAFDVTSAHPASPADGLNFIQGGSLVIASAPTLVDNVTTQYVASGWTGTGDVPASGTGNQTPSFPLDNPSAIVWQWSTNVWFETAVSGTGTVDRVSEWVAIGSSQTITATPGPFQQFLGWSGSANGTANPLTLTASEALSLTAIFGPSPFDLTVISAQGTPTPSVGVHNFGGPTSLNLSVAAPPATPAGGWQYVPAGWIGTGDLPVSGAGSSIGPITLTQDSSVNWLWQTNVWLDAGAGTGGSVSPNGDWVALGSSRSFNASPNAHYTFTQWTGDTSGASENGTTIILPADGPRSVQAEFELNQYALTVSSDPAAVEPLPGSYTFDALNNLTLSVTTPIIQLNGLETVFEGWTGTGDIPAFGTNSSVNITLTQASSIDWHWTTNAFLTVASSTGGSVDQASAWHAFGSNVMLTATADTHWTFAGWSGDLGGGNASQPTLALTMNQARSVQATFVRKDYTLAVASAYGTTTPPVGTTTHPSETLVVSAVATGAITNGGTRYLLQGWQASGAAPATGSSASTGPFALTESSSVTWLWTTQVWLQVDSDPGIAIDTTGGWFYLGQSVTLNAAPATHFTFEGWSGDTAGANTNASLLTVVMDQPRSLLAHGTGLGYNLLVDAGPFTATPPNGLHTFAANRSLDAQAGPALVTSGPERYRLTGWTGSGSISSGSGFSTGPFDLLVDSSITWTYDTEFYLDLSADANGSLDAASDWFAPGQMVTVTATPVAHYAFDAWTGHLSGASISGNSVVLPMTQARSVQASFTRQTYTLDVQSSVGSSTPAVGTHAYPSESVVTVGLDNALVVDGTTRHRATGFVGTGSMPSGSGSTTGAIVLDEAASTLTWMWEEDRRLDIATEGLGTVDQSSAWFPLGTTTVLNATADPHFQFVDWSGDLANATANGTKLSLPMTQARSVTARFERVDYPLTIVSANGTPSPAHGTYRLPAESTQTVTGGPTEIIQGGERLRLLGWNATGSASAGSGSAVPAFALLQATEITWLWQTNVLLAADALIGGTLTTDPSGWFAPGASVTLQASADAHYIFDRWTGDIGTADATNPSLTLTMDQPRELSATFKRQTYALTIANPHGMSTPPAGTQQLPSESLVRAQITPNVEQGQTRFDALGWHASGAIGDGTGTDTGEFALDRDTSIQWLWQTNFYLTLGPAASIDQPSAWHPAGATITVTATPKPFFFLGGWTGDLDGTVSVGNTLVIPMDRPRAIEAVFTREQYSLNIDSPFGETTPAIGTNNFGAASTVTVSVVDTELSSLGTRHRVIGWSGFGAIGSGNGDNTGPFVLDEPTTVSWNWETDHQLTLDAQPGGTVTPTAAWHLDGSTVTIEATAANPNYTFAGWTGDLSGFDPSANPASVPMDQPRTLTATFTANTYELLVASPYGTPNPGTGIHTYLSLTTVEPFIDKTTIENAGTQHVCIGWTGTGDITSGTGSSVPKFGITQDSEVTWAWQTNYRLETDAVGGSVDQPSDWHAANETVVLSATPQPFHRFAGWTGDVPAGDEAANPLSVTMDQARNLTATFEPVRVGLQVDSAYGASTPAFGTHTYDQGTEVTVSMNATLIEDGAVRHRLQGWSGTGSFSSGTGNTLGPAQLLADSTITWRWTDEFRLDTTKQPGGTVSGGGWYDDQDTASVVATPEPHWRFDQWSGDIVGDPGANPLSLTMDAPRQVEAQFVRTTYELTVQSTVAGTQPPSGVLSVPSESTQRFSAPAISDFGPDDGARFERLGWTGTGSLAGSGTDGEVEATILEDSSLRWTWATAYELTASTTAGTITGNGWYRDGETAILELSLPADLRVIGWEGDTSGGNALSSTRFQVPMDRPRDVRPVLAPVDIQLVEDGTARSVPYNTEEVLSTTATSTADDTRTTVTGWTGTGNVPANGSGEETPSIIFTEDSSIDWTRLTEHRVELSGTQQSSGWVEAGQIVNVDAAPPEHYAFVRWTGYVPAGSVTNPNLTLSIDAPTRLQAEYAVKRTEAGVPHTWFDDEGILPPVDDTDHDGDGMTAAEEWITGTTPTDAESVFHVTKIEIDPGTQTLAWPSVAGRVYTIQAAAHPGGPYKTFEENIAATEPSNTWTAPKSGETQRHFFRILVERSSAE